MPENEIGPFITSQESPEKIQTRLSDMKSNWASHIKSKHLGIPATSCHNCINYKQKVIFLEEELIISSSGKHLEK